MQQEELTANFDRQAPGYDKQWAKLAPIRDGLHFLVESVFAGLPSDARILCVGVGTGAEMAHLALRFPGWRFTAVDPSGGMLEVCRCRVEEQGFVTRCNFHEGYLDSLPVEEAHDAATCFLVSQFIMEHDARSDFFRSIARRLKPGGILTSSDLASDVRSNAFESLLKTWLNMMAGADVPPEGLERMRAAYASDVSILPPATVAAIIESGGFETPVQFFQAGLLHAWYSKRAAELKHS